MSKKAWADFFGSKVFKGRTGDGTPSQRRGILRGAIIPGANMRSGSATSGYEVHAVIGYALQRSIPPAILANWNSARASGR